ncbi:hypothetical protein A2197_01235 [Candidatus Woesebacteria bacterium RIFOXYA1_FULL_48_16]|uniref:Uncharacterized protein n=1 Tax=Candidatus Woesebacteria bacterium RIFOXYA1_FULL_48_16 TaxID=1802535 RepID=A0A1F8CTK9_9BACT|nr:MAG: hypothetical protein A2197_01235 [Candidatus Woesebacteria bacterium RIFOXYA1_FULL_48_16]
MTDLDKIDLINTAIAELLKVTGINDLSIKFSRLVGSAAYIAYLHTASSVVITDKEFTVNAQALVLLVRKRLITSLKETIALLENDIERFENWGVDDDEVEKVVQE